MGEINRVFVHIDAFVESGDGGHLDSITKVIGACIGDAKRIYVDQDMADEALVARIDRVDDRLKELANRSPNGLEELKSDLKDVAIEAMSCRRATLPLVNPKRPWEPLDPRDTLFDDDDQYSFAIYDTLADGIASLLPEIEQLACECAWEAEDDVS